MPDPVDLGVLMAQQQAEAQALYDQMVALVAWDGEAPSDPICAICEEPCDATPSRASGRRYHLGCAEAENRGVPFYGRGNRWGNRPERSVKR